MGLTCRSSRLPPREGVTLAFDCDRPGWLVIEVGDMEDAVAALEPLWAVIDGLRGDMITALMGWQAESTPADRPSCGLMTIHDPEVWSLVAEPWSGVTVFEAGGALGALAQMLRDLRDREGREALLLTESSYEAVANPRWAERDDVAALLGDLQLTVHEHMESFQDPGGAAPVHLEGLVDELQSLPVTMALFLLHELSVIDAFGLQAAAFEPLRTTPDDEARRYDWFRELLQVHIPPLLVGAFAKNKVLEGKMLCAAPPIEFDEAESAVNVIGIRAMYDWSPIPPRINEYDDWICVVWRENGRNRCLGWRASVDPGTKGFTKKVITEGTEVITTENVSHIENGQWRYFYGVHTPKRGGEAYPALQPLDGFVWWWFAPAGEPRNGQETTKEKRNGDPPGVNIHAGGNGKTVNNTSQGCPLIHGGTESTAWQTFIDIIKKAANKDDIPFTLIDSSMLPDTSPLRPGGK